MIDELIKYPALDLSIMTARDGLTACQCAEKRHFTDIAMKLKVTKKYEK